jgi:hypothetical protein
VCARVWRGVVLGDICVVLEDKRAGSFIVTWLQAQATAHCVARTCERRSTALSHPAAATFDRHSWEMRGRVVCAKQQQRHCHYTIGGVDALVDAPTRAQTGLDHIREGAVQQTCSTTGTTAVRYRLKPDHGWLCGVERRQACVEATTAQPRLTHQARTMHHQQHLGARRAGGSSAGAGSRAAGCRQLARNSTRRRVAVVRNSVTLPTMPTMPGVFGHGCGCGGIEQLHRRSGVLVRR